MLTRFLMFLLTAAFAVCPESVRADDPFPFGLTLKDHPVEPSVRGANVRAVNKLALVMARLDRAIQEQKRILFNVIWMAGSSPAMTGSVVSKETARTFAPLTIELKPLAAGRYPFRGEFHDPTAQGVLIVE